MGITFRDGNYLRRVNFGKRTIKDGEAAVIWSRTGKSREIIGPSLQHMFSSTIRFLTRHTANKTQYLVIDHASGVVEHSRGPVSVFENPVKHRSVKVMDGINLTANECIIVTTDQVATRSKKVKAADEEEKVDEMERRVVNGPALFIPAVSEIVAEYDWTGTREGKVINLRQHTIEWKGVVKTSDDLDFQVTVDVTVRIIDVTKAVGCSNPIAVMLGAVRSDYSRICAGCTSDTIYDALVQQNNDLTSLQRASASVGFQVHSTLTRSVAKPKFLQDTLAREQAAKAAHQSQLEAAESKAALEDAEAKFRLNRARQVEEVAEAEFAASSRQELHRHQLAKAEQEHRLELQQESAAAEIQAKQNENQVVLHFLGKLSEFKVDLTSYLTSIGWEGSEQDMRTQAAVAARVNGNGRKASMRSMLSSSS